MFIGLSPNMLRFAMIQEHFKIIIKTPVVGYELVTANYDVLSNGTKSIIVERSGVRLTTLLITTDLKPNGGRVDIDWRATANLWATLSGSISPSDISTKRTF